MQTNKECPICNTASLDRPPIKCQYCDGTACHTCWETYFITDNPTILQPRCMFPECRREFIVEFLHNNQFLNKPLRERQSNVLFDIDRTYYPLAQHVIELMNTQKNSTTKAERDVYDLLIHDAIMGINHKTFISNRSRKCPIDNCLGRLDMSHYCSLCKNTICIHCNKPCEPDVEHTCAEIDRQTMAAIRNDAKECPTCGMYISKIDGCNDMFCIKCNTPFKYDTRIINMGRNSNPLYINYVQRTAATAADDGQLYDIRPPPPCGIQVNAYFINDITQQINLKFGRVERTTDKNNVLNLVNAMTRFTLHLRAVIDDNSKKTYDPATTFWTNNHLINSARVELLQGKNTPDEYKAYLYMHYKTNEYIQRTNQISEMFIQCTHDILIEFYQIIVLKTTTAYEIIEWGLMNKIEKLVEYANQCFAVTNGIYKSHIVKQIQHKTNIVLYNPTAKYNFKTNKSVIELVLHPALLNNTAYQKYNSLMQEYQQQTHGAFTLLDAD